MGNKDAENKPVNEKKEFKISQREVKPGKIINVGPRIFKGSTVVKVDGKDETVLSKTRFVPIEIIEKYKLGDSLFVK